MRRITYLIAVLLISIYAYSQSIEKGQVVEYNGYEKKPPLADVELNIVGCPSTVSDTGGNFELSFPVLKAGQLVKYNEIYKSGYIIFNKEAVDSWRISNNGSPFRIVMCKEELFRSLKRKYYGIIDNSYKEEYNRQVKLAEQYRSDAEVYKQKLSEAEKEYRRRQGDINTYVDMFARIDLETLNKNEKDAIQYLGEGNIDAAVKAYEEMNLMVLASEQLERFEAGTAMKVAGDAMEQESHDALSSLTDKLERLYSLYESQGIDAYEKMDSTLYQLEVIYRSLRGRYGDMYNESLGKCLVRKYYRGAQNAISLLEEAVALPSAIGCLGMAVYYENLIGLGYTENMDNLRYVLDKGLALEQGVDENVKSQLHNIWLSTSDFSESIDSYNRLYFKVVEEGKKVFIGKACPTYAGVDSVRESEICIPSTVMHNGIKYSITGIAGGVFLYDLELRKVLLPTSCTAIGRETFSIGLDTIVISPACSKLHISSIPLRTQIIIPSKRENSIYEWIGEYILERADSIFNRIRTDTIIAKDEYLNPLISLIDQVIDDKNIKNMRTVLMVIRGDAYAELENYQMAILSYKEGIGGSNKEDSLYAYLLMKQSLCYNRLGNYKKEFENLREAIKTDIPDAYNELAYMYAKGQYVEQDLDMALKLIDRAIEINPMDANLYDSKGEFFMMMGNETAALGCWEMVMEKDPDFDFSRSELYKYLFHAKDKRNEDGQTYQNSHALTEIYYWVVSSLAANSLYRDLKADCIPVDYGELYSISILSCNALIKNKPESTLKKYKVSHVATALNWAMRNELRIRYGETFEKISNDYNDDVDIFPEEKDKIRFRVWRTIFRMYILIKNWSWAYPSWSHRATGYNSSLISETSFIADEILTSVYRLKCDFISLPQKNQSLIKQVLFNDQGMTLREIAENLNIPVEEVSQVLSNFLSTKDNYMH